MERKYKWGGGVIVAVLLVAAVSVIAVKILSDRKLERVVRLEIKPVAFVNDAANVARGKYLYESRGCMECHGASGNGQTVLDDPSGFFVKAPNITSASGGIGASYTERDWVAAIRHGVNPRGRPLLVMPSEDYSRWTDADLAALVSYVRQLDPAQGQASIIRMPLMVKALYAFGGIKDAAEKIDHSLPPSEPIPTAVSIEHGAYVANVCMGCHGPALEGGPIPGAPPDWPPAANLTSAPGGVMQRYATFESFKTMLKSGKRSDGSAISKVMPFSSLGRIDDTDVAALYAFLRAK